MSISDEQSVAVRNATATNDSRVLCCFGDQESARPFESALMECGVSLLRARHGMHAYWLAIASKPAMAIIDARQMDLGSDVLFLRMEQNKAMANMPVLVMTDEPLPITMTEQFTAIPAEILPSHLAARVRDLLAELDRVKKQNVDEYFSLWDDAPAVQDFSPKKNSFIRTDAASENLSSRTPMDAQRRSTPRIRK